MYLSEPCILQKKMKEYLVRLLYVEMLGHDGSFGYIYAVNLTSSRILLEKRTGSTIPCEMNILMCTTASGYLTVSLCLHQDHELILLLISNIQRVCCCCCVLWDSFDPTSPGHGQQQLSRSICSIDDSHEAGECRDCTSNFGLPRSSFRPLEVSFVVYPHGAA